MAAPTSLYSFPYFSLSPQTAHNKQYQETKHGTQCDPLILSQHLFKYIIQLHLTTPPYLASTRKLNIYILKPKRLLPFYNMLLGILCLQYVKEAAVSMFCKRGKKEVENVGDFILLTPLHSKAQC